MPKTRPIRPSPNHRLTDSPEWRRVNARRAIAIRYNGPDSPEAAEFTRQANAIMATEWARALVARMPDLDAETRHTIARILLGDFDRPDVSRERGA